MNDYYSDDQDDQDGKVGYLKSEDEWEDVDDEDDLVSEEDNKAESYGAKDITKKIDNTKQQLDKSK